MSEFPANSADSGLPPDAISGEVASHSGLGLDPELVENTDDVPTVLSKNREDSDSGGSLSQAIQSAASDRLRGKRLAHFELIGPIGTGGMAAVLLARDTQLDRLVALKILPPDAASDPEMVKRFHQEARAAAKLDHDHVARVFYCGEDKGLHFIAFEFVEGDNLRTLLEKRGPLPAEEALNYMAQIASGLAHAANRGVVHRDIKPSNIIVTPEGKAKLVDMGLARVETPATGEDLTHSGVTLGTFEYISPEQALEPRRVDVRSDIYSLGCTFYHVLTGHPPVPDGTAAKKLHFHQNVPPIDPRQWNPRLPDCVALILSRAMAKKPEDRYQSAEDLLADIHAALRLIQESSRSTVTLAARAVSPSPTGRLGVVLVAGFALLVLLVVAASWFNPSEPIPAPPFEAIQAVRRSSDSDSGPAQPAVPPQKVAPKEQPRPNRLTVKVDSEQQLREAFASQAEVIDVEITQPIAVMGEAIRFEGRTKDGRVRKLRLHGTGTGSAILSRDIPVGRKPQPLIVLDGGEAVVSAIRFRVSLDETPQEDDLSVVSIQRGDAKFTESVFEVSLPRAGAIGQPLSVASVVAAGANEAAQTDGKRPTLSFERCWFAAGAIACRLEGPTVTEFRDCAFGPHSTIVRIGGRSEWLSTQVTMDYCTLLVTDGSVFDVGRQIVAEVALSHSIVTYVNEEGTTAEAPSRALVYQRGESNMLAKFATNHNCYHALDAFWRNDAGRAYVNASEFFDFLSRAGVRAGVDRKSFVLEPSGQPLEVADPLAYLRQQPPDGLTAFTANLKLLAMRSSDDIGRPIIGTHWVAGRPVYSKLRFPAGLPPLTPPNPSTPAPDPDAGKLIVDGKGENGHYKYLSWVFDDLEEDAEATIWIKQNGGLAVRPIEISRLGKVVIRPYPGHRPILTLAPRGGDSQSAMFNIAQGEILFEGIGFELAPTSKARGPQALVALHPSGRCHFKSCSITLRPAVGYSGDLAVARLVADPPKDTTPASAATLEFTDCLVRGMGDGIHVYDRIPPAIQVGNTLVALDGSFVVVQATHEVMPSVGSTELRLNRMTGYVTGHLIRVRQDARHFAVPVRAKVADSLFISGGGESLAYVEGVRSKQRLALLLQWSGFHNAYCGFDSFFSGQMLQPGMAFPSVDKFGWQMKETMGGETGNTRFLPQIPEFPSSLDRLTPEQVAKAIEETADSDRNAEKEDPLSRFGAILSRLQTIVPSTATGASEGVSSTSPAGETGADTGESASFLRKP